MTLLENPEYNTLLQAVSIGNKLLTLLESQENKINELTAQVDAGLTVSDAEVTARIRAELQAQFDTAFNDALSLIGASTSQLSIIRDSILGVHTEPVAPVEPPEEEPVIPSL
jgi:hypothetical protein